MKTCNLIWFLAIGFYGLQLCEVKSENLEAPPWQAVGKYTYQRIQESSGIAASRRFENVYWTLNDSGHPPILYATTLTGELIQEFFVEGVTNYDWEALGIDAMERLWIGEIGNNNQTRDDLKLYVVPEPNPFIDSEAKAIAEYRYRYPDDNVDAEAMFIHNGFPYIVSKERDRAVLYCLNVLAPDKINVLQRIGEFRDANLVTGSDISADGERLVVCTYNALWIYHKDTDNLPRFILSDPWTLPHDFGTEAVSFENHDLVLTNELGNIYRLPNWWYEQELHLPPSDVISAVECSETIEAEGVEVSQESYKSAGLNIGGRHVVATSMTTGGTISHVIDVPRTDRYELHVVLTRGPIYAQVELLANRTVVGEPYDCYARKMIAGTVVTFGTAPLKAGANKITLRITGKSSNSENYKIGIDSYFARSNSAFPKSYMILGPFSKVNALRLKPPLDPRTELNLNGTYTGLNGDTIKWKKVSAKTDGKLDLRVNIGTYETVVGYVLTYVYTDKTTDSILLVGSDDEASVWLNGTNVLYHGNQRRAIPDEYVVPCQLKAGWNTVLCQIGQKDGDWGIYLRFTDPTGSLTYETQ